MPSRLRDQHLAQVIEALLRYAADQHKLAYQSEREADDLTITFRLSEADFYHETLTQVMKDMPLNRA